MPASYQPETRGDGDEQKSVSQSLETNLKAAETTVRHILDQKGGEVISIRPDATIGAAVELLRDRKIGAVVVTDESGALTGILSERDIVRRLADTPGQTLPQTVAELMTPDPQTCAPDESLVRLLRRMTDGRFRHMPVVEEGAMIGMVSIGDVVNFRLTALEYEALQLKQLIVG
ncbi:MAG: CBS domain-containing protein [Rhodobacteraceae bacterium]|jgi:CBS domain-containing protein|uniref:CBS domain-containing protein n=1 Tax=Salipiger profundus TaxID=1229727 RepID=A0A1U7D9D8_9RHOB|nr:MULTISPECIES: CBS domain-containing protein [Salipiger]APX24743.1 CBS domain-containing protein [Salipiger profundus]MAB07665.1 CBS domain-containing protein [Paracoccaceae bacterium]GFZ97463.1 inosine-5-monophosphate dehydrogenase [Salipiger profundus]SFD00587.1 CBS domain-containing protein [Salipiger profundus]